MRSTLDYMCSGRSQALPHESHKRPFLKTKVFLPLPWAKNESHLISIPFSESRFQFLTVRSVFETIFLSLPQGRDTLCG